MEPEDIQRLQSQESVEKQHRQNHIQNQIIERIKNKLRHIALNPGSETKNARLGYLATELDRI